MKKQLIGIGLAALAVSASAASNAAVQADVVVYGSTPAAISVAIQAKRMGRSVVMVSPETRIGGLTTGGLGQTDIGNKAAFGGVALEFYKAVGKHYGEKADKWRFEPSAALAILEGWEKREGLDIRRNEWLNREHGVERTDGRIVSIKTLSGKTYRGKVFIDATYEGDLMAAAGVSYHVGREANAVYGETLNGNQPGMAIHHQLSPGVDPFVVPGDPKSGLLRGVEPYDPNLKPGDGDTRVQAYCFRMCLTDDPANKIPFAKPDGYDERDYELMFRHYEAVPPGKVKKLAPPWINSKMPNRKTDTNNKRGFSTDFIGQSWRWAEGTYEEREQILAAHLKYQKGLMWTLANHPRVPEVIRRKVSRWGMCKDEFLDGFGGGWQKQLYVREARRMVGEYVMTEHNCRGKAVAARPIAMGAYAMDSHHVRRYVGADGFVHNEGDVEVSRDEKGNRYPPYSIDYGAIVPKRGECANLLVPVCVSASHIAFGSIRMEPVFFALGQAAGTAAAIACAKSAAVQDVPYAELRERLLADGQVVELSAPSAATGAKGFAPSSLDEIAARLKPLRTWALPYAAGVPYESYVSRKKAPKDLDKLDPEKVRKAAQPWTRLSADAFFPYIDKYGQFVHKDWPDKVHSDADFARQREKEAGDLAAHPGPKGWDKWGGWADGPTFEKTGGFSTTKWNGKWWIVDPDGHLWWSHGPVRVSPSCATTPLATPAGDRSGWFAELPARDDSVFGAFYESSDVLLWPYYGKRGIDKVYDFSAANLRRKYGEKWFETWADLAHRRLRSWGCNTIANGSDKRICLMDRTPYTERFEIHSRPIAGHKGGWWEFPDPFDPSFRAEARRMTEVYKAEINDPWCMGFFVDNEHKFGKPHTFGLSTLKSPSSQPCKVVFRERLAAKYGTVEKLNAAWKTAYADWDAFLSETKEPKSLKGAMGDLEAFSSEIAENYFRIIREELKRANPGKLYLGCRWAGGASAFTVKAAAKYCDVISYNVYRTEMSEFKLPEGVDAPVLIGEFHFGALDRGPFCPGLILLRDQKHRAETYRKYVRTSLEHPQIVGVHWHQFSDQAASGRFDGENMQVGWTDVCDTPYWETIQAVREMGGRMYEIRAGGSARCGAGSPSERRGK